MTTFRDIQKVAMESQAELIEILETEQGYKDVVIKNIESNIGGGCEVKFESAKGMHCVILRSGYVSVPTQN